MTSIALSYFRGATFTSGDPVPSSGAISINDDFKGRTFGTQTVTGYEFNSTHLPSQSQIYNGMARGFYFQNTTGSTMTITEIKAPEDNSGSPPNPQSIWVGNLGTSPPPNYSANTTTSNSVMVKNNTDDWWIVPNSGLSTPNNNYVGLLAQEGTNTNSYGAGNTNAITFPSGHNIVISRFLHQGVLATNTSGASSLTVSAGGGTPIGRIFFKYTLT